MEDRMERIRARAHELWETNGREHGRDSEHWLQAEREIDAVEAGGHQANEGEGNRTAARRYNAAVKRHIEIGHVDQEAHDAAAATDGPERHELARAEKKGRSRSRGEDPVVRPGRSP
jgi:hypothetical protein